MTKTISRIKREGVVSFGDASLGICEEPDAPVGFGSDYERNFKRQVFARIIQQLRRIGWTVSMPPIDPNSVKHYGGNVARWSAESHRDCSKGDLKGELEICGRSIKFEMWQGINTPTRPDHGGRYERDKEVCMPYVLRLEMERTRRRIRGYLCNVFTDYTMSTRRPSKRMPGETAIESISRRWAESERSTPDKWEEAAREMAERDAYNSKSRDGIRLQHGQKVYTWDRKGRWLVGHAYSDGGMWNVITGPYTYERKCSSEIIVTRPHDLRVKCNSEERRKRLERLLQEAIKTMDFKRAIVLKGILFPDGPLYAIFSKQHNCYFDVMYCGYRNSISDAGKYTLDELRPYLGDKLETDHLKAIPVA